MAKRIISFSLYRTERIYQIGALKNLELQPIYYPGWTCRFYISQEIPSHVVNRLREGGAELVQMERLGNFDGLFWRFLPASEPDLDALIVRDVDSRHSRRGQCAVQAWLESGKGFHIMRDHPLHLTPILAGAWGCIGGLFPDMEQLIADFSTGHFLDCHSFDLRSANAAQDRSERVLEANTH